MYMKGIIYFNPSVEYNVFTYAIQILYHHLLMYHNGFNLVSHCLHINARLLMAIFHFTSTFVLLESQEYRITLLQNLFCFHRYRIIYTNILQLVKGSIFRQHQHSGPGNFVDVWRQNATHACLCMTHSLPPSFTYTLKNAPPLSLRPQCSHFLWEHCRRLRDAPWLPAPSAAHKRDRPSSVMAFRRKAR